MASMLAKYVSKKILNETAGNRYGKEDPYFEHVPASRLDGRRSGKTVKRRKALPPGISEHDGKVLTKVKRRAYRLDYGFDLCGIKFGWGSVIGIVPAIGDLLDLFMALMVVRTCNTVEGGLPTSLRSKMLLNTALDFFVGLIPFIGDIADAVVRCNTMNAKALEDYLRKKGAANLKAQGQPMAALDPSLPEEFDRDSDEDTAPPRYQAAPAMTAPRPQPPMQSPSQPAKAAQPKKGGRGWLNGGGTNERDRDLEQGRVQPAR
ncbi:MAG: hypothetical protein M1817_005707 [Caeruleum heppii]|nr:MAG: hypothetical protein M1817_005707 [Caeruleum heppii]